MERFLEIEDKRYQKVSSKNNFNDSDSDVDYFADEFLDEGYDVSWSASVILSY